MDEDSTIVEQRNFSVKYSILSESLWLITAELLDSQHNIITKLEVRVPDLVVEAASIEFNNQPLEQCREICDKANELVGCEIVHELSQKLDELFVGPLGCPNVRSLFGISGPGFIYIYYPYLMKEGKMSQQDWWKMVGTELKDECIAHRRMAELFSK